MEIEVLTDAEWKEIWDKAENIPEDKCRAEFRVRRGIVTFFHRYCEYDFAHVKICNHGKVSMFDHNDFYDFESVKGLLDHLKAREDSYFVSAIYSWFVFMRRGVRQWLKRHRTRKTLSDHLPNVLISLVRSYQ